MESRRLPLWHSPVRARQRAVGTAALQGRTHSSCVAPTPSQEAALGQALGARVGAAPRRCGPKAAWQKAGVSLRLHRQGPRIPGGHRSLLYKEELKQTLGFSSCSESAEHSGRGLLPPPCGEMKVAHVRSGGAAGSSSWCGWDAGGTADTCPPPPLLVETSRESRQKHEVQTKKERHVLLALLQQRATCRVLSAQPPERRAGRAERDTQCLLKCGTGSPWTSNRRLRITVQKGK